MRGEGEERERQGGISDEKLPMITDAGAETALNDRSWFFCAICGTFTSTAGLAVVVYDGGAPVKSGDERCGEPRPWKPPFAIAGILRIVP